MGRKSGHVALPLTGDLEFLAGALATSDLAGEFVKFIGGDGSIVSQDAHGDERTVSLQTLLGTLVSNASTRVITASPVTIAGTTYVDAGFDWPELIPFLLVQWNPAGRRNHSSFQIIYNPRVGRYPGDDTGVAAAAVGDAPSAANSIGYAVPFAISAGREVEAAQASFGITSANRALIACSDATQDPNPLVVLAIIPQRSTGDGGGGVGRSSVLQEAVAGTPGAGVNNITLPADYATYKWLTIVGLDGSQGTGGRTLNLTVPTAWLAAQVANEEFAISFAVFSWNPTTRVLDAGGDADRILYAELHDGGARGERGEQGERGAPGSGIDEQARTRLDAVEAFDGTIRPQVADLLRKGADLDIVSDGPGYVEAAAAEAGIAIFAEGSTIGDGLLNGTRRLEAGDVSGYSFLQSVTLGATVQAVVVRIEGTLGPLDFALRTGSVENAIHTSDKVLSAGDFDYYYLGGQSNERIQIDKRTDTTHTTFGGELVGRALDQIGTAVEEEVADHEPDPSVTVDPPVWGLNAEARTLFFTIHDLMPTPQLQAVDKIRLDVAGALFITHDWTLRNGPRVVAFHLPTGTDLRNVTNNAGSGVRGQLTFHATAGGNPSGANERLNLPFAMDPVAPEDVPDVGGHSTLVEHPRVFHANTISTPDPDDSTRVSVDFSPNEGGLTPIANSLFTFTWNVNPGFGIYRTTMAPRGTPSADATVVALTDRNSGTAAVSVSDQLVRGTTYLARYAGSAIIILTALQNDAAAANLLFDNAANPIAATSANRDKILYRAGRLWTNEPIHFADPTATYRDFATSDLPTGFTWGGAVQVSPSAGGQPDNRIIYSRPGGHFLRKITGGGSSWWVNYSPPNWRGNQPNESAADHAIRGVGDVVFFGGKVQVAATYVPRTADQWHWVPMEKRRFEAVVGASPAVLPEGTHELAVLLRSVQNTNRNYKPLRVLLSDIPAADRRFFARGAGNDTTIATMRYNAATRTLIYSAAGNDANIENIKAIGEA